MSVGEISKFIFCRGDEQDEVESYEASELLTSELHSSDMSELESDTTDTNSDEDSDSVISEQSNSSSEASVNFVLQEEVEESSHNLQDHANALEGLILPTLPLSLPEPL